MIKAIETRYKGYRFRSRLEARWAVFFDALRIEWEYEKEGFEPPDAGYYLPDFWLPTFNGGMWAEVKPVRLNDEEEHKARLLCNNTDREVWLCVGVPDTRVYRVLTPPSSWSKDWPTEYEGVPNADQAWGENRMYTCPGYEDRDGFIRGECLNYLGQHYLGAVESAKGARFEHGENGA
jgi:hypothetical protein